MTRNLTIALPDEIADEAEAEASETGKTIDELVTSCVIEHVGRKAIAEIRKRNSDLDEDSAMKLAYEELDAYRAERDSS